MLVYGAGGSLFLPGAGADPIWSESESAPGPRTSEAGLRNTGFPTAWSIRKKPCYKYGKTFFPSD